MTVEGPGELIECLVSPGEFRATANDYSGDTFEFPEEEALEFRRRYEKQKRDGTIKYDQECEKMWLELGSMFEEDSDLDDPSGPKML